jgi:hypothetical protein
MIISLLKRLVGVLKTVYFFISAPKMVLGFLAMLVVFGAASWFLAKYQGLFPLLTAWVFFYLGWNGSSIWGNFQKSKSEQLFAAVSLHEQSIDAKSVDAKDLTAKPAAAKESPLTPIM